MLNDLNSVESLVEIKTSKATLQMFYAYRCSGSVKLLLSANQVKE